MTAIDDKYASLGGAHGFLGQPITPETTCPDGVGHFRHFAGGSIYWHPTTGAHEVHGAIREKWSRMGWERSILGYPVTDESDAADGGRVNHFMGGSIYWTATSGANLVYGPIRDKWQTLGWESSALGFPISDPVDNASGELRQQFQGGVVSWTPQDGVKLMNEPEKKDKVVRVFPVRWADLRNPQNYTREFFQQYFFSVGESFNNPDGNPMPGSIFDYFYGISDGYLRISGQVDDWIDNPLRVTQTGHWYGGLTGFRAGDPTMEAGIVAPTLRAKGIRTLDDLRVNGRVPDVLVFFHIDVWAGGGATRSMADVRRILQDQGRMDLWDSAWDAWLGMDVILVPCTYQNPDPHPRPDGTFDRVPNLSELRWAPYSALAHEFVHALTKQQWDLYNGEWQWGTWFELMSYSVKTDYPVYMSSYVQERSGWFNITDMPRHTHRGLILDPFETHNVAYRFQNGPMENPETLVLENRTRWDYNQTPPTQLSNGLFAYRIDPKRRQSVRDRFRRSSFVISRSGAWREIWGIPEAPELTGQGADLGNSLNHLGELWWEFRNIRLLEDGAVEFDAIFQPINLIRQYTSATWTNSEGKLLKPDKFFGSQGHVMLVNRSLPIEQGRRYNHVLSLHPNWVANGKIKGRYSLRIPATGARLYLTVALSEQASGSDGFIFRVIAHGSPDRVMADTTLNADRNIRLVVVDLSDFRGSTRDITLEVDAGANAYRDWAYLLEAYLVPTSNLIYNFIDQAPFAIWRSNGGTVPFNVAGQPQGEASKRERAKLQNGALYGGDVLFTHPAWQNDGFIEGVFSLTLPGEASVFRAEVGFDENRVVTDNGARVMLFFVSGSGTETLLLGDTINDGGVPRKRGFLLERSPAIGEVGLHQNPVTSIAIPIPAHLRGVRGQFILRVDADGSAGQDWVWWTMARLTTD
ncbi:hypothetical protein J5X98_00195 [Leptothermofonsia sichuanensis E412]|uniref:LGFP repeat-containing protein n=1 Tax=Leptothermofonsia sichuanensis TaxID=2917832 RepID=UPI001CA6D747|nr:hypothetical protein [Leptothermofonsia sichuanensis]QZZ20977.1 hypothetical protein J5X98_00195 [Leptothermofonsia sichuanensis E412]